MLHNDSVERGAELRTQNASFSEPSSFPILFKTLELLLAVLDLVATNKALKASWNERKSSILVLVRDLTAKKLGTFCATRPSLRMFIISQTPLAETRPSVSAESWR